MTEQNPHIVLHVEICYCLNMLNITSDDHHSCGYLVVVLRYTLRYYIGASASCYLLLGFRDGHRQHTVVCLTLGYTGWLIEKKLMGSSWKLSLILMGFLNTSHDPVNDWVVNLGSTCTKTACDHPKHRINSNFHSSSVEVAWEVVYKRGTFVSPRVSICPHLPVG